MRGGIGPAKWIPLLQWLPGYRREWLRSDVIAGLTVWALVVPQAIAYAQMAGLPPQAGVFASFAAPLGYALFGSSRQLIVSPTSATAAISAAVVAPLAVSGDAAAYAALSAALAMLCGLLFLLLGRFNMGFLAQFIAPSVQTGLLFGIGLTIIVGQVTKVLGISSGDGPFYRQAWHVLRSLDETNGWTLLLGAAALATLLLLSRTMPRLPAALLLVVLSVVAVNLFNLDDRGVTVVGAIERAIPLPAIPDVSIRDLLLLVPGSLAIIVIGYSESMAVARQFADRHHYRVNANQELTALGVSNLLGGLFQGFVASGGASQSAANDRAGARTQISAVVLSALALLSAIVLMPLFRNLPQAVLGAIVINAALGFIAIPAMNRLRRLRIDAFWVAMVALAGVLLLGILAGLLVGVALSILLLLGRLSRPVGDELGQVPGSDLFVPIESEAEVAVRPGLLIYRSEIPFLFINAAWDLDRIRAAIARQAVPPRVVVLDLSANSELDVAGIELLATLQRELTHQGQELWLSRVRPNVADAIARSDLTASFTPERMHRTNREADAAFKARFPSSGMARPGVPGEHDSAM